MESVCKAQYIEHKDTGYFSTLVKDYIAQSEHLQAFVAFSPDDIGLKNAIEKRKTLPINRNVLVEVLKQQYTRCNLSEKVENNINLLLDENTFTVCTAHQPNLMGGYLYFIYKIIHAVRLASHLKEQNPDLNFVPVYYIGSEDDDFEELSVFKYEGKQYQWKTQQTGAVGRMHTNELKPLIDELFKVLGPPGINDEKLRSIILEAYANGRNIADATRVLVHALLGEYGIVVLDPDDTQLKQLFADIIKQELIAPKAYELVQNTSEKLSIHYKSQAYTRPINFFYLKENIRERIERNNEEWQVLNTDILFNQDELLQEIEHHPERFSPNVILRGLFQESILPNVAFIGGGSEVAYWMQLQDVFNYYNVFFPAVILRQSALWIDEQSMKRMDHMHLTSKMIFEKIDLLQKNYAKENAGYRLDLKDENIALEQVISKLKTKIINIDSTLEHSADAALAKMAHQVKVLEKKIMRSERRKQAVDMERLLKIRSKLFPNESLQERSDSFLELYMNFGRCFFDCLLKHTLPYGQQFLVLQNTAHA